MQDPLAAAEAMRIPFVLYIGQRGGPSTGTVIYSQQELNLARFGGNGEGLRLILAPSNLQELYDFTVLAFDWAWRYRLPVIILSDGYLSKMTGTVELKRAGRVFAAKPTVQNGNKVVNLRNCYSQESELGQKLKEELSDFGAVSKIVEKCETLECVEAKLVVYAWGSVSNAAREAVKNLRKKGIKVGLFRPITMKPFSATRAKQVAAAAGKILTVESAEGQFTRMVTEALFGVEGVELHRFYKPAEGITAEEIEKRVMEVLK
jgi:2-oxoglutarate ferredoxin oxidoreductase subunit alpha